MRKENIGIEQYNSCNLCPRNCKVDRGFQKGYCRVGDKIKVARAALHMWEEPCISASSGSGTVFFSGCTMGCVFCQNKEISRGEAGKEISMERLVDIFFELADKGANNINLVTGDMFIPSIRVAIEVARNRGIRIPFLLNTSSYLRVDSVRSLDGLIDIYLPDMKYIRDEDAVRYSSARDYVDICKNAIEEMVNQQPKCEFITNAKGENIIKKGVIVRHLLMPGMLIQAKMIVRYLHERYGDDIYISLMNQYTPGSQLEKYPEINRRVTQREYDSLVNYAAQIGVTNGFMQVGETACDSFIPVFDLEGV